MGVILVVKIFFIVIFSTIFASGFDYKWTEERKEAFFVAGCIARCEKNKSCRKECYGPSKRNTDATLFGAKGPRFSGPANFNATLHCKDFDVIKINHNSGIWVIEESSIHDNSWSKTGRIQVSEKMSSAFRNLSAGTSYRYKAYKIISDGVISEPEISPWYSTFEMNHQPLKINGVQVTNQILDDKNPAGVRADVVIQPAADRSCLYDIISWNENEGLTIAEFESSQDFRFSLDNLDFATNVTIFVSARNTGSLENSKNSSVAFVTPSCFQLQRNLTFCAPDRVKGLRINGIFENGSDYGIIVGWNAPEFIPDSYILQFQYFDNINDETSVITIPGNSTETVINIEKSKVDNLERIISIVAESSGGISAETWIYINIEEMLNIFSAKASTASNNFFKDGIMAASSIALFMVVAGIFYAYNLQRHKRKTNDDKNRYKYCQNLKESGKNFEQSFYGLGKATSMEFEKKYPLIPTDEFEICPIQLKITDVLLGSGAYGTVRLGRFYTRKKQAIDVAVKTLRDDANAEDLKNFRQEISIMKSAGQHPNIVSIIGCCTLDIKNPLLIVEYCSRGDLQTYLRTLWQEIMSQALERRARCEISIQDNAVKGMPANNVENAMNITSWIVTNQVAIANKMYDIQEEYKATPKANEELTVADLLKFARQVASGMEFLSSNRIIHRDLAARNVLLCVDKTVKISDFGLSRDIYQENVYKKQGNGRLPLKWMAIEALTHQIYTTKSDVWSFGILLWEIVTLGSNPYPETPTNMVLQLLKSGYRMKKPDNCGNELYNIMRSCWHSRPRYRPNFTQLKNQLDRLLVIVNSNENLNILREPINSCDSSKLVNNHYSNIYSK